MLKHIKINRDNIGLATEIEKSIFDGLDVSMNYQQSIEGVTENNYFILYVGDTPVGVSGLFRYPFDRESGWLGWFGIKEEYRRRRFGSDALRLCEETARDLGFKYLRVLVDRDKLGDCIKFFAVNGYTAEQYDTSSDPESKKREYIILSRSLLAERLPLWNNRNLKLTEQFNSMKNYNQSKAK